MSSAKAIGNKILGLPFTETLPYFPRTRPGSDSIYSCLLVNMWTSQIPNPNDVEKQIQMLRCLGPKNISVTNADSSWVIVSWHYFFTSLPSFVKSVPANLQVCFSTQECSVKKKTFWGTQAGPSGSLSWRSNFEAFQKSSISFLAATLKVELSKTFE